MDHRRTTLNKPGRWRGGAAGLALPLVCVGLLAATTPVARAQGGARFGGRLSVMPVDFATRPTVSGSGDAEAVLEDRTLTLAGTFDGLSSPATAAHLHRAPPARRGPAEFPLDVTNAASGRVEGDIELDDTQIQALHRGEYYVQIRTRNNPDGEIRGWLLPRPEAATATPSAVSYLASQARTGAVAFRNVSASCHQDDLSGGFDTPELAGPVFRSGWEGRPARELLGYVKAAMPPAGRRPDDDTLAAIVAYILQQNGAGAGDRALSAASEGTIGP